MNVTLRSAMAVAAMALGTQAAAQITFYEGEGFQGRTFTTERQIGNFERFGFNDLASSVEVLGDRWEICEHAQFEGRCIVLRPGRYPSLVSMGMNNRISSVRAVNTNERIDDNRYAPAAAAARITFYEREGFQGQTFTTERQIGNFERFGFNDRASSVEVLGDRWEVCDDAGFSGRCIVLRPGRYPSLAAMGMNNRISSARAVNTNSRIDDNRYAPAPVIGRDYGDGRDYRRRNDERLYEANVTSVRAVVGPPEQRCWIEREQVIQEQNRPAGPAGIAGALIGGILGHQIGGGGQQVQTQDVQRCTSVPSQAPTHWDVTYNFRGQEHRVQMSAPPGPTITVNERGEPRA